MWEIDHWVLQWIHRMWESNGRIVSFLTNIQILCQVTCRKRQCGNWFPALQGEVRERSWRVGGAGRVAKSSPLRFFSVLILVHNFFIIYSGTALPNEIDWTANNEVKRTCHLRGCFCLLKKTGKMFSVLVGTKDAGPSPRIRVLISFIKRFSFRYLLKRSQNPRCPT